MGGNKLRGAARLHDGTEGDDGGNHPVPPGARKFSSYRYLYIHWCIVALIYFFTALISFLLIRLPEAGANLISLLSTGAIVASFGSAIVAAAMIWTSDRTERIFLNVDILFKDVAGDEPWRRWPFLGRRSYSKTYKGGLLGEVHNPHFKIPLGVHSIYVTFPTVRDDLFDLPLWANYNELRRVQVAARTYLSSAEETIVDPQSQRSGFTCLLAYECLLQIWTDVLIFRVARYFVHFGVGLTAVSCLLTGAWVFWKF